MTIPDSGHMLMMENESIALPCTPKEEKQIITDLTNNSQSSFKEGNSYYLISTRWFTGWQKYTGFCAYPFDEVLPQPPLSVSNVSDKPGPIDNCNIVSNGSKCEGDDIQLLDNLEEQRDYVLVSQNVWEKLFEWYKGGPVLPRKVISVGVRQNLVVEVYPLCLKLIDARDESESTIRLSKKASLHELYKTVCSLKGIAPEKVRIWDYYNNWKHEWLVDSMKTLEDSHLQMNQARWATLLGEPPIDDDTEIDDWLPRFLVLHGSCIYLYLVSTDLSPQDSTLLSDVVEVDRLPCFTREDGELRHNFYILTRQGLRYECSSVSKIQVDAWLTALHEDCNLQPK